MSGARFTGFTDEKLSGEAVLEGNEIRARVSGTASQREVAPLEAFFAMLAREAMITDPPRLLTLDVRDLRYMNSSHFKLLISMVAKLKKSPAPVKLRLLVNDAYHWQKRGLPALKHLAEDLIDIE